jgi:hypothetical protein
VTFWLFRLGTQVVTEEKPKASPWADGLLPTEFEVIKWLARHLWDHHRYSTVVTLLFISFQGGWCALSPAFFGLLCCKGASKGTWVMAAMAAER